MKIVNLDIKNYRNYSDLILDFKQNLNVFVGKNAQGKTNLIESIFFCGLGKSFKTAKDSEVIKWQQESARVQIEVEKKYRNQKICINLFKNAKKSIKIDEIYIKKANLLLGEMPIVFFSPNELKLIKESPEERRRFLNIGISQVDKKYIYALSRYEKILQNRNKLLKVTRNLIDLKDTIEIWDKVLVENAEIIYNKRKEFIKQILPFAKLAHTYISDGKEDIDLVYKSIFDEKDVNSIKKCEKNEKKCDFKTNLLKNLKKNLEKDFKLGYTSCGVHRDDIDIFLNEIEVKQFGSQGQQRTVALALKLAELEIFKERMGEYPILLLDDVFSELDGERRKRLLNFTQRCQTFITCTDFEYNVNNCELFYIENNKIKNKIDN